jgi:signal peptidase I
MVNAIRFPSSLLDLNGTASRKRGWIIFGLMLLVLGAAPVLAESHPDLAPAGFIAMGAVTILWIVVLVQRLHATGRSGYWALLAVVPLVGIIAGVVILSLPHRDVARRGHPFARRVGAVALMVLGLIFVSRAIYWQPYWIPAESMKPTLLVGDFLIVTTVSHDDLKRGDVIVFRHPVNGSDFIKRLIGLPGDKIQMKEGILYINDVMAPQEPDGVFEEVYAPQGPMRNRPRCENGGVEEGGICQKSRFIETLPGGISHGILNIAADGVADNTDVFTVPEGEYFFLGDNRDNSFDSRFSQSSGGVGFVPSANIRSRARIILLSSAGRFIADLTSWRADRFFEIVQ